VSEVQKSVDRIASVTERVFGKPGDLEVIGADAKKGAFYPPLLFYSKDPFGASEPHDVEAFGPVNTVMPYKTVDDAIALARKGRGSLCGSVFTANDDTARQVALGVTAYHGCLLMVNRQSAKESTGHGSPMPHLVHGGPGRAGGGEEIGGVRGVLHYMQRTALQGSPSTLTRVVREYLQGAEQKTARRRRRHHDRATAVRGESRRVRAVRRRPHQLQREPLHALAARTGRGSRLDRRGDQPVSP
jgi:oxepin-CoA hydrolase/3-oxo-5,6-dehydrosuberyl-CoA semialdehyde dehydrogenase